MGARRNKWKYWAIFFLGVIVGFLVSPVKYGIGNNNGNTTSNNNRYYTPLEDVQVK